MGVRMLLRSASVSAVALGVLTTGIVSASASYSSSPSPVRYSPNSTVFAVAVTADRVYIGGKFTRLTDLSTGTVVSRSHLAAFDRQTGDLLPWAPVADADVRGLAVDPATGEVYAGGYFTSLSGASGPYVAGILPDGTVDTQWRPNPNKAVRSIVVDGSSIYLAGLFGSIGGVGRAGVARVNDTTGAADAAWAAKTVGGRPRVIALAANGQDLMIGGSFTSINGAPRSFLGSVSLADGSVTGWTPPAICSDCDVFSLATNGDAVFAGVGGHPGGTAARYEYSTGALDWSLHADGNVQSIAYADGTVYAGGHFGPSFARSNRHQIAAVSADQGTLLPWNPVLGSPDYPGVWALVATSDALFVGGAFTSVGGGAPAKFAEFPTI